MFFKKYAIETYYKTLEKNTNKEKEKLLIHQFNNLPSTIDIIKKIDDTDIIRIHYPLSDGLKSHQLNYACKYLLTEKIISPNDFFVFYDADSFIEQETFEFADSLIHLNDAKIIQQSAVYSNNLSLFKNNFLDRLVAYFGFMQSRWTLAHEVPRLQNQMHPIFSILESGHIVGHGLIVNENVFRSVGYFPENFLNEDMILGLIFRLNGYNIHIMPKLEKSTTPSTLNSVINQYRTWFYGVFTYPIYIKYCWDLNLNKTLSFIWGMRYFLRSLLWLFNSIFWIALLGSLFVFSLYTSNINIKILLIMSVINFLLYSTFSVIHMNFVLKNLDDEFYKNFNYKNIFMLPINICLYSLGPILAVYDYINRLFFKKPINKSKTER